jgi:adhesin transport system outer membrane protein
LKNNFFVENKNYFIKTSLGQDKIHSFQLIKKHSQALPSNAVGNSLEFDLHPNKNLQRAVYNQKKPMVHDKFYFEKNYLAKQNEQNLNLLNVPESNFVEKSNFLKIVRVGDTKKELNVLVKDLVNKADNPSKLANFKKFKKIIAVPFGSTPLFLQTLESLKIAEERKNIAFSKFLPRVTSSIGGGIKSSGLNNDSSSQSKSLTISQLVYDFGVTSRQYQVTEKEEISSQYKIDQQRTDLLVQIINSYFEVYRAKTLLMLSQGFVESRREFLDSVKVREQIGGSSNADVIRAETKLSEALDRIPTEVKNLKNSEAVFAEYFDTYPANNAKLHQTPSTENVIYKLSNENIDKNFVIGDIFNQIMAAELNLQAEKRSRFGKFGVQAGYQNTDTNLNTPQEQSSILLTYQIDVFTGFETKAKISQARLKLNALRFELERAKKELVKELKQSENSYEAQSALVLSRVALVKGAELSNQVNRELFELNKTSINDLFRSQEEFLTAAKNLVDATVEKNLSFYRLAAKFGTLLNLFELRT